MKHIFLYNPAAGQGEAKSRIEAAVEQHSDCELYVTKEPRDATRYIEKRLAASPDEPLCFVACGGNGIINGVDGQLQPQGNASRAQIATILMRYMQL